VPVVALAAAPGLVEPFTSARWYAFGAVVAGWLLAERLLCRERGLPSLVRRTWVGWLALAAWMVGGSLRHGPGWAMAPLLARGGLATLALAAYWSFRRQRLSLGALRGSVALTAAVVIGLGLLQMAGLRPLPWLSNGDGRSATFGNVNMAAQFVGLALVVLFSRPLATGEALARRLPMEVLGLAGFGYVALAGTRSVALALVTAFVVLALVRRSRESLARAVVAVGVAAFVFLAPWPSEPQDAAARESKATSARWRLAVWADTLDLVRDHPLGVGGGNFEHAFTPYALAGRSRPGEALVFRSPHNEYLRLVAEEGVPAAILLLGLLLLLLRDLNRSPTMGGWGSDVGALLASGGAFLAVEAFFQFPFELAFRPSSRRCSAWPWPRRDSCRGWFRVPRRRRAVVLSRGLSRARRGWPWPTTVRDPPWRLPPSACPRPAPPDACGRPPGTTAGPAGTPPRAARRGPRPLARVLPGPQAPRRGPPRRRRTRRGLPARPRIRRALPRNELAGAARRAGVRAGAGRGPYLM
jgi:O-antigen ligase